MASPPHHLPSLWFLFTVLLCNSINGKSVNPPNAACPSFDCGNGHVIGYPFWARDHQSQTQHYCGYPGLGLSCSGRQPTLLLSGNLYRVENIDISQNTLTAVYDEIKGGGCPVAPHGVTLNASSSPFFNYTADDEQLRFFYNCSLYPPSLPSVDCLQRGAKRSFVFPIHAVPEFDWDRYCESTVTVPVMNKTDPDGRGMRDGFKLTWRPNRQCHSCESTGGFCGHTHALHHNFVCFCSDGQHYANCHDNGGKSLSVMFRPNYIVMAAGAVTFGSLIIAATVFYFVQKKRSAWHTPAFSRIPNTGK